MTSSSAKADDPVRRAVVESDFAAYCDDPRLRRDDGNTHDLTRPPRRTEGRARRQAARACRATTPPDRAALISKTYRDGGNSGAIRSETDALAYALARMPATYAAVTASLNALREIRPDFAPNSLLDVGAGPGTASWAAAEAFPSLQSFHAARRQRRACARWRSISSRDSTRLARRQLRARRSARRARQSRAGRSRHRELYDRRNRRGRANARSPS